MRTIFDQAPFDDVECDTCGARPGEACRTPTGRIAQHEHQARWKAAKKQERTLQAARS